MGFGPIASNLYQGLYRKEIIRPGQSMLELGAQEVYLTPEQLASLGRTFGYPALPECHWSRDLMAALGFTDFECIDTSGEHGAWRRDLNVRQGLPRQWDIVTNHGTTEHVFDQANCFRLMHEACKPGGVMIHCVPLHGYDGHCFYTYKSELFTALAEANGYKVWRNQAVPDTDYGPGAILSSVALGKRGDTPFRVPQQELYKCT